MGYYIKQNFKKLTFSDFFFFEISETLNLIIKQLQIGESGSGNKKNFILTVINQSN